MKLPELPKKLKSSSSKYKYSTLKRHSVLPEPELRGLYLKALKTYQETGDHQAISDLFLEQLIFWIDQEEEREQEQEIEKEISDLSRELEQKGFQLPKPEDQSIGTLEKYLKILKQIQKNYLED